ncbi:hypothetical protein OG474_21280 [Kribbella sp. NBC_01505]|uniref:hypothetical protein n=1 Tax=Kribbella sp. NBC_01505 TaxID=2903580 RepID=UPI00386C31E5
MISLRKLTATAAVAVAVSVFSPVPAHAAILPPPTDFTLSWQGDKLRLTWKDGGDANYVHVEYPNLGQNNVFLASRHADDSDELLLPANLLHSDRVRLYVQSYDGTSFSQPAYSEWFDTEVPAVPYLQDASLAPGAQVRLIWSQIASPDQTPNDPLDRPVDRLYATVGATDGPPAYQVPLPVGGESTATIDAQPRPAIVRLEAANDWGTASTSTGDDDKFVRVARAGVGIAVPTQQVYSQTLAIKSTLDLFTTAGREDQVTGIPVELQTRPTSTAAWKTSGRYAGNTTAAFDTGIAALGNRQYRLWVPGRKKVSAHEITLIPEVSTSAKSSVTLTKFTAAGFSPSTAKLGATVNLSAKIQPAATVQGTLQRWTGKTWINGSKVQFKNGTALVPIKASGATARYRVNLGPFVFNGLTINATTSSTFTLTIR